MARVKVSFEIEIPDDIDYTDGELYEWAQFEATQSGSLSNSNPLYKTRLKIMPFTFDIETS